MKKVKSAIAISLAVIVGVWFAIAENAAWWEYILSIAVSISAFYWINETFEKTWSWIVVTIIGIFAIRFAVLPILVFCLTAGLWVIGMAGEAVIWAFGTLGIVGGIIILVLLIPVLKGLFK